MRAYCFAGFVLVALLGGCVHEDPRTADQRRRFEQEQVEQRAFELSFFDKIGFTPLASATAAHRQLRRVFYNDPYFMLPIPAVEIERRKDGTVTLRVIGYGWKTAPATLSPQIWDQLGRNDAVLFKKHVFKPWNEIPLGLPPPPPPICHVWVVRLANTGPQGEQTASAVGSCHADYDHTGMDYAAEVARLALGTRPDCKDEPRNELWSFQQCFGPKPH